MLEKSVSYAVSGARAVRRDSEREDLADTAEAGLKPVAEIFAESEAHYRDLLGHAPTSWLAGQPELQQAIRWNLFQLAQATARADVAGIPAKGVSGSGYDGHYFWDQEVYLLPYLTYTNPDDARQVLEFRHEMLPEAKIRAKELSVDGALFPWRTINGLEASAYYAAGTAQFHIAAAIAFATNRYIWASGDAEFQETLGAELLIETARMWVSLGFFGKDGLFHIHGVTGPDEYTAVVNDNLYTNVMARFNLRAAAALDHPEIDDAERELWEQAANRMQLPYDEDLQVALAGQRLHDPGAVGLDHAPVQVPAAAALPPAGDLPAPGPEAGGHGAGHVPAVAGLHRRGKAPRLRLLRSHHHGRLHPVRLRPGHHGRRGGLRQGRAGPLHPRRCSSTWTTPTATRSTACTSPPPAGCGARWSAASPGCATRAHVPYFDPRLPGEWETLRFHLKMQGRLLLVELDQGAITLTVLDGDALDVDVRGVRFTVASEPVRVPLEPVHVPEPTVFPSGPPTASIPVVRAR